MTQFRHRTEIYKARNKNFRDILKHLIEFGSHRSCFAMAKIISALNVQFIETKTISRFKCAFNAMQERFRLWSTAWLIISRPWYWKTCWTLHNCNNIQETSSSSDSRFWKSFSHWFSVANDLWSVFTSFKLLTSRESSSLSSENINLELWN